MGSCKILTVILIVRRLRKLFCGPRRSRGAPDECLIAVDTDQGSQIPESSTSSPPPSPSVDEDSEPRYADAVQQGEPPLPSSCSRLQPEDIKIIGKHPSRAGAFADVWDASLADDRVVVKAYRIYSATDSAQARMVRPRWHLQPSRFIDLPSATEVL